jgi:hypothetical protein
MLDVRQSALRQVHSSDVFPLPPEEVRLNLPDLRTETVLEDGDEVDESLGVSGWWAVSGVNRGRLVFDITATRMRSTRR